MRKVLKIVLFLTVQLVQSVPPNPISVVTDDLKDEFSSLRNTIKVLSDQWEKWNTFFITSLEPRIISTASTLASIDSNIHNLQERAHVWDTFQLHVAAWNDQLASLDRKIDIINKGQEKLLSIEAKIDKIISLEYKLENTIKTINSVQDTVRHLDTILPGKHTKNSEDSLYNEFITRGVLSSIKLIERKLERLVAANQNLLVKVKANENTNVQITCDTPKVIEEILNDISSKIDVMFDNEVNSNLNASEGRTFGDYDNEYLELSEDSGEPLNYKQKPNGNRSKNSRKPCHRTNQALEELLTRTLRIENTTLVMLDRGNIQFEKLLNDDFSSKVIDHVNKSTAEVTKDINIILGSYFSEQKAHFESFINKRGIAVCDCRYASAECATQFDSVLTTQAVEIATSVSNRSDIVTESVQQSWTSIRNENKSSCEDLSDDDILESGVYLFENSLDRDNAGFFFEKRYCDIRNDGRWTVIQRRDNYSNQNNFNVSWEKYKYGFGDLHKDFWMGNEFLYKFSNKRSVKLRVELEDFENNMAWAEYDEFVVSSEENNYKITIGGYWGNASDSLSSHNGASFSTFDKNNDEAPECCPCAVSYGGGWWFNRCFESNLNGVYYRKQNENTYFRGIIWEHWLGNYSLKKSVMMIKSKGQVYSQTPTTRKAEEDTIPFYEDP